MVKDCIKWLLITKTLLQHVENLRCFQLFCTSSHLLHHSLHVKFQRPELVDYSDLVVLLLSVQHGQEVVQLGNAERIPQDFPWVDFLEYELVVLEGFLSLIEPVKAEDERQLVTVQLSHGMDIVMDGTFMVQGEGLWVVGDAEFP